MAHAKLTRSAQDTRLDRQIGLLLRTGTLVSAAVILLGGGLFLVSQGHLVPEYHVFEGVPDHLDSLRGILSGAFHFQPIAIVQFGILLLIATPIARVLFAAIGFAVERDYLYVAISSIVFTILLYSLIRH